MRVGRLFRSIDAKFLLALTALLVVGTICYGFVQRGDHITAAEDSVSALSTQLGDLSAENRRLRTELDTIQRQSTVRDRRAARERDALLRELLRLNEWLRSHGINVPAPTMYATPTHTTPPPRPTASPSSPPRHPHGNGGGKAPGNSGGHAHGHGPKNNQAGPLGALPALPALP